MEHARKARQFCLTLAAVLTARVSGMANASELGKAPGAGGQRGWIPAACRPRGCQVDPHAAHERVGPTRRVPSRVTVRTSQQGEDVFAS